MTTKKKPRKQRANHLESARTAADALRFQIEALSQSVEILSRRVQALTLADRMCWVTVEGRWIDGSAPSEATVTARLLASVKVRPVAWTKGVIVRHDDARPVVWFDPYRTMRVDRVRVYGAGAIVSVRVGRESVGVGDSCQALAVVQVDLICEIGNRIEVALGPVVPT